MQADIGTGVAIARLGSSGTSRRWRPSSWARKARGSETLKAWLLLAAPALILVGAIVVPLATLLAFSFWTQSYLSIDPTFTLANYAEIASNPLHAKLLMRSIWISGTVALLTVGLGYPVAYFIAFDVERRMLWLILVTLPFWTSYLLRILSWKIILGYNGVINSSLIEAGIVTEPVGALLYNPASVLITLVHSWAAFAILPIYVSLQKIDRTLIDAAADLGDGPLRRFLRVTLPLSMPGVLSAVVLIFVPTFGDYVTPQLVGGPSGVMVGNFISMQFGASNNWPLGAALSAVAMGVATLLACLFIILGRALTGLAR